LTGILRVKRSIIHNSLSINELRRGGGRARVTP